MNSLPMLASVISLVVQALKAVIKDRLPDEVYPVFALILGVVVSTMIARKCTILLHCLDTDTVNLGGLASQA